MLPSWCNQTVTVMRAPYVTQRGTKVRDWANAQPHVVGGCSLQEGSTSTDWPTIRQADESDATLYAPLGADVQADDRVSLGGRTWSVNGVPRQMQSPLGITSHVEAPLKEWRG